MVSSLIEQELTTVEQKFLDATDTAERVKRSLGQARETYTILDDRNKTELKLQGQGIMDTVTQYEAQEPIDKVSRYMRDSFRTIQQTVG